MIIGLQLALASLLGRILYGRLIPGHIDILNIRSRQSQGPFLLCGVHETMETHGSHVQGQRCDEANAGSLQPGLSS